jgi:hypothetical protein
MWTATNQLRMWLPLESLEIVYCTWLMKIGCQVLKTIVDGVLHQYQFAGLTSHNPVMQAANFVKR